MKRLFIFLSLVFALLLSNVATTSAQMVLWDETVHGDLSNDPLNPTQILAPGEGSFSIVASVQSPDDTRDFFTFFTQLTPEHLLDNLLLTGYSNAAGGPADTGFAHVELGFSTSIPSAGTVVNYLGSTHLTNALESTDILPALGAAPTGGQGFSGSLSASAGLTFNFQQTGPELINYSLQFEVSAVPEPGTLTAALLLAVGLGLQRRR